MARRQPSPGGRVVPVRFRTGWHRHAACANKLSDLFYGPEGEHPAERLAREDAALSICACCVVRDQCRAHALGLPESYGIWGGTTEAARSAGRQ